MKIESLVAFRPRRLHSIPGLEEEPGHDALREENPLVARLIECAHVSAEFSQVLAPGSQAVDLTARSVLAVSAAGAAFWGINKLARGETVLDRVEGVTNLALAADAGLAAAGGAIPGATLALGLVHGAGELIIGGADVLRGREDNSARRTWAGAGQMLSGAGVLTWQLVPGGQVAGASMVMLGTLCRQAAIGF